MNNKWINPLGPLLAEFYSHADPSPASIACIKHHVLDLGVVHAHAGILAVLPCAIEGGRFDFDEGGWPAVVIEVLDEDDETTVDLCAWLADRPDCFGTALGAAVVLGATNITNPATWAFDGLLHIHRRPLDWMKAGCRGVVILDHRDSAVLLGSALGPMVAEDEAHARDLKLMLCAPPVDPRNILLRVAMARRAA